jgi:hypothetical protein
VLLLLLLLFSIVMRDDLTRVYAILEGTDRSWVNAVDKLGLLLCLFVDRC